MSRAVSAIAILGLVGCTGEHATVRDQAITNSTPDDGDPFVVALTDGVTIYCTGTLVAPRVVLTAAHCLRQHRPASIFFGASLELGGEHVAVSHVREEASYDGIAFDGDVGVAILAAPAPVAPVALPAAPLREDQLLGRRVRIVGFGSTRDPADALGRKRMGTTRIRAVGERDLAFEPDPSQPCAGDSGGPALLEIDGVERAVGIASSGNPECNKFANETRVDAYLGFVQRALDATRDRAVATGAPCFGDAACATGSCVAPADATESPYCVAPCDGDAACPDAMTCAEGSCRHPAPSPGALGARCATANECETGSCQRPAGTDRPATCTSRCLPTADTCPTDFTCAPVANAEHACFPASSGCTTAPGAALAPMLLALALLRRRRRPIAVVALALSACNGSSSTEPPPELTYYATVKPIIDRHCAGCHQPDGSGPTPLTELEHVLQQQEIITYMVASNEMPPWPAADSCEPYQQSRALPADQRAQLLDWLRAGAPPGSPDDVAPPIEREPDPVVRSDVVLELPPYLPPAAADRYRCFLLPWSQATATFVTGLAVDPGDVATVHHVNTYAVPEGRTAELAALDDADPDPGFACHGGVGSGMFPPLIAAWTAGQGPIALPIGTGIAVEAQGAILVRLHLHHHAAATSATPIRPRIALELAATVEAEATLVALADPAWAADLVLPPFDPTSVSYQTDLAAALGSWSGGLLEDGAFRLHAVELHMHERGASGQVTVVPGGSGDDCLLDIPFWSSHWPQPYTLAAPRRIEPGDALRVSCSWFNDQPLPARWGTSAADEMCVAWLYVTR